MISAAVKPYRSDESSLQSSKLPNQSGRAERWRSQVSELASAGPRLECQLLLKTVQDIQAEARFVSEKVRAEMSLAIASKALPVELVAFFATQPLAVAAAVLSRARLTVEEWARVRKVATIQCRWFLATLDGSAYREELAFGENDRSLSPVSLTGKAAPGLTSVHVGNRAGERQGNGISQRCDRTIPLFTWPLDKVLATISDCRDDTKPFSCKSFERVSDERGGFPLPLLIKQLAAKLANRLFRIVELSHKAMNEGACSKSQRDILMELSANLQKVTHVIKEIEDI